MTRVNTIEARHSSRTERERAWKQIMRAAKKFDVDLSENSWRELFKGGKSKTR